MRSAHKGCLTIREFVHLRCRPLIVAIETAGETACPTLLDQSFGEVGGAGGFACRWKLISIAHRNPENGYAPVAQSWVVLCRQRRLSSRRVFLSLASLGFFRGLDRAAARWAIP